MEGPKRRRLNGMLFLISFSIFVLLFLFLFKNLIYNIKCLSRSTIFAFQLYFRIFFIFLFLHPYLVNRFLWFICNFLLYTKVVAPWTCLLRNSQSVSVFVYVCV